MSEPALVKSRTIAGRRDGPHLLITAGVHGDEYEPMAAVRQLLTEVDGDRLRGKLTLVAVVNEPAFARGQRTAEDGLDLARTCPGRADGSTTERIAHELSQLIRGADYYVDLHTGGMVLNLLPLAGYALHPNPDILAVQRRMARAFGLPVIWGTSAELEGRSLSVARDAGVPAIYVEWKGGGFDPSGVEVMATGCQAVMAELGMLEGRSPVNHPSIIAEDPRSGSGYMQICYPAPATGFFEPKVAPGDHVVAGQPIGHVSDVLGDKQHDVLVQADGLVIGVRSVARVEEGTALAVIIEASLLKNTP